MTNLIGHGPQIVGPFDISSSNRLQKRETNYVLEGQTSFRAIDLTEPTEIELNNTMKRCRFKAPNHARNSVEKLFQTQIKWRAKTSIDLSLSL